MTPCVFVIVIVHLRMVGEQCIIGMGIMLITSHHEGEADGADTQNKTSQNTHFINTCTRWVLIIVMGQAASLHYIVYKHSAHPPRTENFLRYSWIMQNMDKYQRKVDPCYCNGSGRLSSHM